MSMAKKASTAKSMPKSTPADVFLKASSKIDAHAEYTTSTTRNVCHNLHPPRSGNHHSYLQYPSSTTVPKAGNRLLETEAKFLRISPLDRRRNSSGRGDLVSDITTTNQSYTEVERSKVKLSRFGKAYEAFKASFMECVISRLTVPLNLCMLLL